MPPPRPQHFQARRAVLAHHIQTRSWAAVAVGVATTRSTCPSPLRLYGGEAGALGWKSKDHFLLAHCGLASRASW